MQLDATSIIEALVCFPSLNLQVEMDSLKQELPAYLVRAVDTDADISLLEWWKHNAQHPTQVVSCCCKDPTASAIIYCYGMCIFPFKNFIWGAY